jgi:penicillin-binding protein
MYDMHQKVKDEFKDYGPTRSLEVYDSETKKNKLKEFPVQIGSMLMENSTGRIISFIGGRDHKIEETNHATFAVRQNGSTMKPLLVYAPAIEYGLIGAGSPVVDIIPDVLDVSTGKPWPVRNFDPDEELGIIPARQALATSQNLAASRLYMSIIDRNPISFLEKLKFTELHKFDYSAPSMALGGMTNGVTIQQNTNAYATLANNGQYVDSYMIENRNARWKYCVSA